MQIIGISYPFGEIDSSVASGSSLPENGSLLPIHGHDSNLAHVAILTGGPLACLHLVRAGREGEHLQR